jgi:hypothetical protein
MLANRARLASGRVTARLSKGEQMVGSRRSGLRGDVSRDWGSVRRTAQRAVPTREAGSGRRFILMIEPPL